MPREKQPHSRERRQTVLLLGNYRPTVAVARALSRHGYRVAVGLGGGEGCTEYSRFVDEAWDHPPLAESSEAFLTALLALFAARPDISVVYPVAEEFVCFFAASAQLIPHHVVVASPRPETVRTCCDKLAMLQLAQRLGVDHLPFRRARSLAEVRAAAEEIGFPLVVRSLDNLVRLGHKKALIARSLNELAQMLRESAQQREILLQHRALGERRDILFAASAGCILRAMQVRYLRTNHVEGTGLCVHGEIEPVAERLIEQSQRLVRALDYTGIGAAQFMVDGATGDICFLELNPRTSAIHRVTEESGMELSFCAVALARSGTLPAPEGTFRYQPGRRYAWTYGELRAIKSALRYREIGIVGATRWLLQSLGTAICADFHLTWRRDDPLPTIMLFLRQFGRVRPPANRSQAPSAKSIATHSLDAAQGGAR